MRLVACSATARTQAWAPSSRRAVKKSHARIASAWERRNGDQEGPGPARRGVDSGFLPNLPHRRCRYLHSQAGQLAVDPAVAPSGVLAGQPEQQCPDVPAGGRPVLPRTGRAAQRRRTMPRCQRMLVPGVTSSRSPQRRAFGITPCRIASSARSAQLKFGRSGCRRCNTASWWRMIKISAVFPVSSHRDSRSHETTLVITTKTNRTRMTGNPHGQTAGKATLLARAADEILGNAQGAQRRSRVAGPGNRGPGSNPAGREGGLRVTRGRHRSPTKRWASSSQSQYPRRP